MNQRSADNAQEQLSVRNRPHEVRYRQLASDLADTQRLQNISTLLIQQGDIDALFAELLTAAMAVMSSDMASLQLLNQSRRELKLLAYRGFAPESAVFWALVSADSGSTCGMAIERGERVVVADVDDCALMAGTQDYLEYQRSGVRAVQSTPLVSRAGRPLGMISTHWQKPHQPSDRDLQLFDVLARQAADLLERHATEALVSGQNRVLELLATGSPLPDVLAALLGLVETHSDGWLGSILLRHEDGAHFARGAAPSLPAAYIDALHHEPMTPPYANPCAQAAHSRTAVVVADIAADDRWPAAWRSLALSHELRSCYYAPVIGSDGMLLGVLGFYTREPRETSPRNSQLIETAIHLAGIAIQRKIAEDALERRTAQYQALLAAAPLGVYLIDFDFHIREVNPTARPVFGDIPDLIGRDFAEVMRVLWPASYADEVVGIFRHTLETGEPHYTAERITERRDRGVVEYYEWQVNRIPLPDGRPGVVCYFRDVSAQVHTRMAIAESEARLRFMAESMPQKIFTATPAGAVDYFNRQWMEFTGLSFEKIRDWGWTQFVHPDDVEENVRRWRESLRTGEPFQFEHRFRRHDGEYRWHLSRAYALRDADGKATMWIGSNTEIHDQKQIAQEADAARIAAEKANAAKSMFLATISHELRTPLNAIAGYVQILEMELHGPMTAKQKDDLACIKRSEEHLLGLIDEVLDLARISAGHVDYQLYDVRIDTLLRDAEAMVTPQLRARELQYVYSGCDPALRIHTDRDKLQQIMLNLLTNAIKFTPEGGTITVTCLAGEGSVQIAVSDTGPGIAAEHLELIFEPVMQPGRTLSDTTTGAGLGLPISRELARGLGGELRVQSEFGKGSTFTVTLPLAG